ncbi:uncharacterized protein B0H64DRAFT_314328, partial [Chaetomium fimeti]
KLLHGYEAVAPGTPRCSTKPIELVARAVHDIGVWLYRQDTSRHKDDALGRWPPSEEHKRFYRRAFLGTVFSHPWYPDYDQYPEGIADCVGYWAEVRILGGVMLFDRRDPESVSEAAVNAVYIHPDRRLVTYRICRLLEDQKEALALFLGSGTTPSQRCPLPLLPDQANLERVDPTEAIETTGIYRDIWERRPLPPSDSDPRLKDVSDYVNYPSRQDWRESKRRT